MKSTLLSVFFFASLNCTAEFLPLIHGTSVSGRPVTLPAQTKGRIAILIIGFTRGSSVSSGAWSARLKADFARNADVVVFQLPFLEEVPRLFRSMALGGVRKSAGPADQDTMVPVFESEAAFKRLVGFSKPDNAYILVLDRTGEIRRKTTGNADTDYPGVRDSVNQLLRP